MDQRKALGFRDTASALSFGYTLKLGFRMREGFLAGVVLLKCEKLLFTIKLHVEIKVKLTSSGL